MVRPSSRSRAPIPACRSAASSGLTSAHPGACAETLGHRRRDEPDKSRAGGNQREPAFEIFQLRLGNTLDAEPAPGKGAECNVGDRESIAFHETPVRKPRIDDPPLH